MVKNRFTCAFLFILYSISISISLLLLTVSCSTVSGGKGGQSVKTAPLKKLPPRRADSRPPLPPRPPEEDIINDDMPVMAEVAEKAPHLIYENKKFNLDLQSGDIKDVLLALIRDTEIGLVIDPGVSGTIPVMDVKDATLKEVLNYILKPLKLAYSWEGKNIHIFKEPLQTRYFNLDYLASSRQGKRDVSFSTRSNVGGSGGGGATGSTGSTGSTGGSQASGGGSGGGGGQNQSTSDISVDYRNSTWKSFIESLKVLVFGSLQTAQAAQAGQKTVSSMEKKVETFTYADANGKQLIIVPGTGTVVVRAFERELNAVAEFIETFEGSSHRQVWIEAKIVEVNLYNAYQMGIDWGVVANRGGYYGILPEKRSLSSPAMGFNAGSIEQQALASSAGSFQFAVSNNVLDIMLDAIARQGNLKVLASPRISTLNNEKAVIRVVREEAFFNLQTQISQGIGGNVTAPTINVQVVPIGIVMDIIPQISAEGDIMLSVNPDISELLETRQFEVEGAMATQPVIDRRSIDTTAKLKDGETLVIAGIMKERKSQIIKGVPLLYKLPLLGNLFRRTEQNVERTELVILITPRIHVGRTSQQLTREERQRIKDIIQPLRLGDTFTIKEGLKGEVSSFKKEKKKKEEF